MAWQADQARLQQLCQMLVLASSPDTHQQQQVVQAFTKFSQLPDFSMYLVVVFAQMSDQPEVVRQRAGLMLKGHIATLPANVMANGVVEHITVHTMNMMQDSRRSIRHTAGTVLTAMVHKAGLSACGAALERLVGCLESQAPDVVEGALSALGKLCEDGLGLLEKAAAAVPGSSAADAQLFVQWTSQRVLPKVLERATPASPAFARQLALECLNHFAMSGALNTGKIPALQQYGTRYIEVLGSLANDNAQEVLEAVCKGFACVVENSWSCLTQQHYVVILQFMLKASQNPEYGVRFHALAVWLPCADVHDAWGVVAKLLPELVPVLVNNMLYADADYMCMDASNVEDDNAARPDSLDDIKPRFHKESNNIDGEEEEGPPDKTSHGWAADWTARKAAAAALDALSGVFPSEVTQRVLPLIEQKLQHTGWEHQEAGVLALGAIGANCMEKLAQFLPAVMDLLLRLCSSPKPLLRSISCWTVSRFCNWICHERNPNRQQVISSVLKVLLPRCLDRNKRVQEAAISSVLTMLSAAGRQVVPFLNDIADTLVKALALYQIKNLRILYDTIGTLSWAVGPELDKPHYVQMIMAPLMHKFETVSDADVTTLPLFECLGNILGAIGKSIIQLVPKFVMRCVRIINDMAVASQIWEQNPHEYERPDRELMAASVDFLSAVLDGLKERSREIIGQLNFLSVAPLAVKDKSMRVKQSGFFLVATCASICIEPLGPLLAELLPHCAAGLGPTMSPTVASNASWAISEIAAKTPPEVMAPHLDTIVRAVMAILQRREADMQGWQRQGQRQLLQNVCAMVGRLRERTALGAQWRNIYVQLPADLRSRLLQMYGLDL